MNLVRVGRGGGGTLIHSEVGTGTGYIIPSEFGMWGHYFRVNWYVGHYFRVDWYGGTLFPSELVWAGDIISWDFTSQFH